MFFGSRGARLPACFEGHPWTRKVTLVTKHQPYDEAFHVMESLTSLRPQIVQKLLDGCSSVKTKRLPMLTVERLGHPWLTRLDLSKVDFGSRRRTIHAGGSHDQQYSLVVADPAQV